MTVGLGILVMAIAIGIGSMPTEIIDFWIGYFKNLWKNIKYIFHMIFKKDK